MKYITLFAFLPFSYDCDDTGSKISKIDMKTSRITSYIHIFPHKKHYYYYCLSVVNRLMECLGTVQRSLKHRPVTLSVSCTQTVT